MVGKLSDSLAPSGNGGRDPGKEKEEMVSRIRRHGPFDFKDEGSLN